MIGVFFSLPLRNTVLTVPFFAFSFLPLFPTTVLLNDTYRTKPYCSSTWKLYPQHLHTRPPATRGTQTAPSAGSCARWRSICLSAPSHALTGSHCPPGPRSRSWRPCAARSVWRRSEGSCPSGRDLCVNTTLLCNRTVCSCDAVYSAV